MTRPEAMRPDGLLDPRRSVRKYSYTPKTKSLFCPSGCNPAPQADIASRSVIKACDVTSGKVFWACSGWFQQFALPQMLADSWFCFILVVELSFLFSLAGRRAPFELCQHPASMGTYRHDPRTRLIELLKRWLRTHAANPNITEDEARA